MSGRSATTARSTTFSTLQDQITECDRRRVEPNLRKSEIERARRKPPDSLDAYDLFLRALPHLTAGVVEDAKIAIPMLQEALKRDPHYGAAHGYLAWAHEMCFFRGGFLSRRRGRKLC